MEKHELEKIIEEELNGEEILGKFRELGKEKGYMYSSIQFSDVQIKEDKITINILTEQK